MIEEGELSILYIGKHLREKIFVDRYNNIIIGREHFVEKIFVEC